MRIRVVGIILILVWKNQPGLMVNPRRDHFTMELWKNIMSLYLGVYFEKIIDLCLVKNSNT